MRDDQKPERRSERPAETDSPTQTSPKTAAEAISDQQQAPAYEPKFKTFSGQSDHVLPQAHCSGAESNAGSTDWFGQLMNRLHSRDLSGKAVNQVAEFVLEDKDAGTEVSSKGERYVARPSYLQGLQVQLKDAKTAEEAEKLQSIFSIEYMLQKARQIGAAAMTQLGVSPAVQSEVQSAPGADNDKRPSDATFSNYEDFEASLNRRNHLTGAELIGAKPNGELNLATDAILPQATGDNSKSADVVPSRHVDYGVHGEVEDSVFPSPPDVVTAMAPGRPGAILEQMGVQYMDGVPEQIVPERRLDYFIRDVLAARQTIMDTYPDAPPLICLDIKDSAERTSSRPCIASAVAYLAGTPTLGRKADGHFVLFDANGDETPIRLDDVHSRTQWDRVIEEAKKNWSGNRRERRLPDFDETKESFTTAPPGVLSVSFHCVPGHPENLTTRQLFNEIESAQKRVTDNYPKSHRMLHKPPIVELMGCNSATKPEGINELSMAAQVATKEQCWTIGFAGYVNGKSGLAHKDRIQYWKEESEAVLFAPDGSEKGRYKTPISASDWKQILKTTEKRL